MNTHDTLLAALRTRYASLGLGDGVLDNVATQLAASVTEESQIETAVSGVEPMLRLLQSELDKGRNAAAGLKHRVAELEKAEAEARKALADAKAAALKPQPADNGPTAPKDTPAASTHPDGAKPQPANDAAGTETAEQLFERLFKERADSYEKRAQQQQAEIAALTDRLKRQDEEREQAQRLQGRKDIAARLGIAPAYEAVVTSLAATATDDADYESRIKAFKQALTDDGSRSATPPTPAEDQPAKQGEAIAALINAGTRQIVEQSANNHPSPQK